MMRTLGFSEKFTPDVRRATKYIPADEILVLNENHANDLQRAGAKFCDLTPRAMFAEFGLEIPHRHARFFTEPCRACDGKALQFTACTFCGGTKRRVFL